MKKFTILKETRWSLSILIIIFLFSTGCTNGQKTGTARIIAPPVINIPPAKEEISQKGSLYRKDIMVSLYGDSRPKRVGDILTINLVEKTNASKSTSSSATKDTTLGVDAPSIFGKPLHILGKALGVVGEESGAGVAGGANQSFSGQGNNSQSNSLTGDITVLVTEVFANGNLRVEGSKNIIINQGSETVLLTGIVRPDDISKDNVVDSTRIANARISYKGEGMAADATTAGWLARFFISPVWPL